MKTVMLISMAVFFFSGCAVFESRPMKQLAYAEAAFQAATAANAETNPASAAIYQLAKDHLSRARSFYRLKNFKQARAFAVKSRRLSEDAELRAVRGESGSGDVQPLVK